jgi:purine nucleoside phosphorylase
VAPEDIDIVLATHLHFDHAGGFTYRDRSGAVRPRFPNARYVVRRGEWNDATKPHERNRASYLADNFVPLKEAGVIDFTDEDGSIMPCVRVQRTGGHTMHHQIVWIESGADRAVFLADLMPTSAHLPDPWIMGYDLYPMDTLFAKQAFARAVAQRETLVFFEHDPANSGSVHHRAAGQAVAATTHMTNPTIGHHRRQRPVRHGRTDDREEAHHLHAVRRTVRPYVVATLRGKRVAFLARHERGIGISPSELNFRANIYGFKLLGVERILSASAVGSLKEEYRPLDILVPDQFLIARWRNQHLLRPGHPWRTSAFAHPVCSDDCWLSRDCAAAVGARVHRGGTYVNMEGPQFSTLAESRLYRQWGMDVIGMTNLQEAKLAREAEICYATLALVRTTTAGTPITTR